MKYTLGGERVGSGKKMQGEMHNYYRSTFNLSEKWASSAGVGILYPSLVKLAMRGDSFSINVNQDARTIPTLGPLFGSFKMQTDIYQVPVRLYQAILHNNPLAIGLNMQQVKFPILEIETTNLNNIDDGKFSSTCLLKYLGMSGLGRSNGDDKLKRIVNGIPALAYYDIFKTYYANKQEENAYVIGTGKETKHLRWKYPLNGNGLIIKQTHDIDYSVYDVTGSEMVISSSNSAMFKLYFDNPSNAKEILEKNSEDLIIFGFNWHDNNNIDIDIEITIADLLNNELLIYTDSGTRLTTQLNLVQEEVDGKIQYYAMGTINVYNLDGSTAVATLNFNNINVMNIEYTQDENLAIRQFELSNIDDMRYTLLSHHELGVPYSINDFNKLPYKTLYETGSDGVMFNKAPLNGLVLKTYQNDIYNNWLNTEWIEGENGINELTQVAVVDGKFSMDSFIFATKLFNMLNRIAVAGATYEDWQDVVYEEVKRRQIESPIFIASISNEIVFDEIVQTSPADGQPLGELGGRGRASEKSKSGGHAVVKCDEASFIIAITSLTPRQFYTQANEFYLTDVFSMDDVHKPPMDGIGFQDLVGERLAWFDTIVSEDDAVHRSKIGKLPAWIEYMTSVDRAYGDFAETDGKGYMILNRNYEPADDGSIKDATTYIDPSKYNYVFAYTALDAQNFWLEINFEIKARRLMSARLIPNV